MRGQRDSTRAAGLITSVSQRIAGTAAKYRNSREALLELVGDEACGSFLELRDGDIEVFGVDESDTVAWKKLGRLGSRDAKSVGSKTAKKRKGNRTDIWVAAPEETRQTMSWIWTADGGPGGDESVYAHECEFSLSLSIDTTLREK